MTKPRIYLKSMVTPERRGSPSFSPVYHCERVAMGMAKALGVKLYVADDPRVEGSKAHPSLDLAFQAAAPGGPRVLVNLANLPWHFQYVPHEIAHAVYPTDLAEGEDGEQASGLILFELMWVWSFLHGWHKKAIGNNPGIAESLQGAWRLFHTYSLPRKDIRDRWPIMIETCERLKLTIPLYQGDPDRLDLAIEDARLADER